MALCAACVPFFVREMVSMQVVQMRRRGMVQAQQGNEPVKLPQQDNKPAELVARLKLQVAAWQRRAVRCEHYSRMMALVQSKAASWHS